MAEEHEEHKDHEGAITHHEDAHAEPKKGSKIFGLPPVVAIGGVVVFVVIILIMRSKSSGSSSSAGSTAYPVVGGGGSIVPSGGGGGGGESVVPSGGGGFVSPSQTTPSTSVTPSITDVSSPPPSTPTQKVSTTPTYAPLSDTAATGLAINGHQIAPGTTIYAYDSKTHSHIPVGTYAPNAPGESSGKQYIAGLPSAATRQAEGIGMGLFTKQGG